MSTFGIHSHVTQDISYKTAGAENECGVVIRRVYSLDINICAHKDFVDKLINGGGTALHDIWQDCVAPRATFNNAWTKEKAAPPLQISNYVNQLIVCRDRGGRPVKDAR